jgi:ADP-heptose:LPS heptosyltransferase
MHLAAFAGTNTVSVFHKGETKEWQPLYNNSVCVESRTDSINGVTVEEVFEKISGFNFKK